MPQHLALTTLLVHDYDEAIDFFVGRLGFALREDTVLDGRKRWVVVAPPGSRESALLLARADGDEQARAVGRQAGGRVFMFLETDDFARDYAAYLARGVRFVRPPTVQPYGVVAVFEDLSGNRWDLIERSRPPATGIVPERRKRR